MTPNLMRNRQRESLADEDTETEIEDVCMYVCVCVCVCVWRCAALRIHRGTSTSSTKLFPSSPPYIYDVEKVQEGVMLTTEQIDRRFLESERSERSECNVLI